MGQQLSCESYCVSTMQRLAGELNTTESQVSECRVLDSSWPSNGTGSSSMKLQFSWREWQRVSGYLERILSTMEQRRLLDHLLLDVTGLRTIDLGAVWEGVVGVADSEFQSVGDDEVFQPSAP
uniref:Death domain-containing protein n=1 Tax=Macrostomum lignano TaxID=282301 RepID=A0A1I8H5I9_9PLAT